MFLACTVVIANTHPFAIFLECVICISVICTALAQLDSGSFEMLSDGVNTYARYSCVAGYYLVGEGKRTCSGDGTWTFEDPRCGKMILLSINMYLLISAKKFVKQNNLYMQN